MARPVEYKERLNSPEITSIIVPDMLPFDMPYIPILWGAFEPSLFFSNRERLIGLQKSFPLTVGQRKTLSLLSDDNLAMVTRFFQRFDQWVEVADNFIDGLGITDYPDLSKALTPLDFKTMLRQQLRKAKGDVEFAGRQHSMLYPIHSVLREEMEDPDNVKVAEIVLDKHIDTVVNPNMKYMTSANVYYALTDDGLLVTPVIFGPDEGLVDVFQAKGEDKKAPRFVIGRVLNSNDILKRKAIDEILEALKKWGVTHITFTVDLDALSPIEGAFAVRYSPIVTYLGLGCQILPGNITPDDIAVLKHLRYPTPKVRFFLQENQLQNGQQLKTVRKSPLISYAGDYMFAGKELGTDIGMGQGLRLTEGLGIIRIIKEELPKFGMQDGIRLKTEGRYRGAVVEMCGFEDQDKKTSNAAIRFNRAIAL